MSATVAPPEAGPVVSSPSVAQRRAAERLALYGGPRAVTAKYRERWKRIRVGEIAKIAVYAFRGVSTYPTGGPVQVFEQRFADFTGARFAVAMNSGTATLHSAFYAVGVRPGDEVIVPSYTFYASAAPILQCGAAPVFCDIDERTLTADPDDVERRITERTKAICVVHLWGNPARLERFVEIARRHNVALVEDCSHAHGATYQGRSVGTFGDVGCFSMQGSKAVSGGELGMVITNNPTIYDHILALGHYPRAGTEQAAGTYEINELCLGLKYRPHLYGVFLADASLRRLAELNRLRARNYEILREELAGCEAVHTIAELPDARRGGFLEFIVRVHPDRAGGWNRGAFAKAAEAEGVPIAVDRYYALHRAPLFATADLRHCGGAIGLAFEAIVERRRMHGLVELPVTDAVCSQSLTLPPFTNVSEEFVRQCARALRKVAENAAVIRDFRIGR